MLMNEYLKEKILLSYTDSNNPRATKFNQMLFKHMIKEIPVPDHIPINLFMNDDNYYHTLLKSCLQNINQSKEA